jgi:hypothetical protein
MLGHWILNTGACGLADLLSGYGAGSSIEDQRSRRMHSSVECFTQRPTGTYLWALLNLLMSSTSQA